jgi:hypothetical protein
VQHDQRIIFTGLVKADGEPVNNDGVFFEVGANLVGGG